MTYSWRGADSLTEVLYPVGEQMTRRERREGSKSEVGSKPISFSSSCLLLSRDFCGFLHKVCLYSFWFIFLFLQDFSLETVFCKNFFDSIIWLFHPNYFFSPEKRNIQSPSSIVKVFAAQTSTEGCIANGKQGKNLLEERFSLDSFDVSELHYEYFRQVKYSVLWKFMSMFYWMCFFSSSGLVKSNTYWSLMLWNFSWMISPGYQILPIILNHQV